jgi:hypothetical protein
VIYRYETDPGGSPDISDPASIIAVTGSAEFDAPVPSLSPGSYHFAVTSLDRNHNESTVSAPFEVQSPPVPVAQTPVDGTAGLADSVRLVWREASRFTVEVSLDSTFQTSPFIIASVPESSFVVSGLEGQATYAWRVRAGNAGGSSDFSTPSLFTTGFPATPELAYPADFASNIPQSVQLSWHPAKAGDSYAIQLSRSSDFSVIVVDTSGIPDSSYSHSGLASYTIYYWRVRSTNALGTGRWSAAWKFRTEVATDVASSTEIPTEFQLYQNYPNPFNPTTVIRFALPFGSIVDVRIYDMLGREVRALARGDSYGAGVHSLIWDGHDVYGNVVANGMYVYRMTAGEFSQSRRLLFLK